MLGDWHSAETLMVDNENAALRRSRNVDVVGAEPRCRYHHQLIAGVQYFSRHTLWCPDPQGASAVEDLLDLVGVRAVDDNDIEPRLSQHLVALGVVHRPPEHDFSLGHTSDLLLVHGLGMILRTSAMPKLTGGWLPSRRVDAIVDLSGPTRSPLRWLPSGVERTSAQTRQMTAG